MKERALAECPFNGRANVLALMEAGGRALGAVPWEIVFVDDDSPDDTAEVIARIAAEHPNIRCLRRIGGAASLPPLIGAVLNFALSSGLIWRSKPR